MRSFNRDRLRDELRPHEEMSFSASGVIICECGTVIGHQGAAATPSEELWCLAAHQADVALAWVEAQTSEARALLDKFETDYDAADSWLCGADKRRAALGNRLVANLRRVFAWEPVEGDGNGV